MKFCTKCGSKITEQMLFCTSCGNDLRNETTVETNSDHDVDLDATNPKLDYDLNLNTTKPKSDYDMDLVTNETEPEENLTSNLKLSKISKKLMALSLIIILVIVIIIKVGNSLTDPSKLVTRFENDVATNNASDLAKVLYSNDSRLKVDNKSILPLVSYFKSKPTYLNEVIKDLKDDDISPKNINNITLNNTLTLASDGKSFLIFPKYKIYIKPSFIDISTTVKDVTFSINNAQIGKSDTDNSTKEFGPYIPGTYSILANYKGKYITLSKPYSVDLISTNGIAKISIFDDMSYINITSDHDDAAIFVNGKSVNIKVKDATHFGPIDSSSKIYATCLVDGKTLTSERVSATSDTKDLFLSFEEASSNLDLIHTDLDTLFYNYATSIALAVNTNDPSLINTYVAYGSALYKDQNLYIPKTYAAGITETLDNSKIIKYSINDDNNSGSITSSESYTIYASDGTGTHKTFSYVYGFQNNDSAGYQLTSITKAK